MGKLVDHRSLAPGCHLSGEDADQSTQHDVSQADFGSHHDARPVGQRDNVSVAQCCKSHDAIVQITPEARPDPVQLIDTESDAFRHKRVYDREEDRDES